MLPICQTPSDDGAADPGPLSEYQEFILYAGVLKEFVENGILVQQKTTMISICIFFIISIFYEFFEVSSYVQRTFCFIVNPEEQA